MKKVLTLCFSIFTFSFLFGQSAPNFFKQIDHSQIFLSENAETVAQPSDHLLVSLDYESMVNHLRTAPAEGSPEAKAGTVQVQIPISDGTTETFRIWETTPMHPDLAAKYPDIRGYTGRGITNPHHIIKLGHSPAGFFAFLPGENGGSVVSRYAFGQNNYYYVYALNKSDWINEGLIDGVVKTIPMDGEETENDDDERGDLIGLRDGGGDGELVELRNYRFALAATGEYSGAHGGTTESVMGTLMESTMILNSVLERDADLRLFLIAQNDLLVFLDPQADPYTNSNVGLSLLGQNESVLNGIIGLSAFDVGHVYTGGCTDVGGVVSGNVCAAGKSRGVTCHGSSNVAAVTISIAAHEMAHQFSVDHSWNRCGGNFTDQYRSSSAVELGSGSTIESYQGSCGPDNIPGNANIHYCNKSVDEYWFYTHDGGGNVCPITETTSNHHPVAKLDYTDGFFIPIETPFELEGTATDEDGDALTYAWEQIDLGASAPVGTPIGSSPIFRVYDPATTAKRVFPRIQTILSNSFDVYESLPTYSRDMTFSMLVRDNNVDEGAGGLSWQSVEFEATESAGPFLVTYPNNNGLVWKAGEEVEITWDVANTDNNLVKCNAVNILISTDGGFNFDYIAAVATPNDGAQTITVPELISDDVRVRIEAANNIFFDLSNFDLEIGPADEPAYAMIISPEVQQVCVPENAELEIAVEAIAGYDQPVELEIVGGLPAGVDYSFSNNPVMPGETTTIIIDMATVTDDGDFVVELEATSNGVSVIRNLFFNVVYSDFSTLELMTPPNGSSGHELLAEFEWTDLEQADFYDIQIARSPSFEPSTIVDEQFNLTGGSFTSGVALEPSTVYFWRLRPSNECGRASYTQTSVFQTFTSSCDVFESANVPQNISGIGLPVVESVTSIAQSGTISDVNIFKIKGFHNGIQDLKVSVISPQLTEVVLFDNLPCGNASEFNFGLDDESPFPIECPPLDGLKYVPEELLEKFNGENTLGNWMLRIEVVDEFGDGGILNEWGIEFCAAVDALHPYLVEHQDICALPNETRPIHNFELFALDPDNPGADLVFTVVDDVEHGFLSKNGSPLPVGGTFDLIDLSSLDITYTNTNGSAESDAFSFIVTDGNGGLLGTPKFNIEIDANCLVSTREGLDTENIHVFPNPASSELTVSIQQALSSDATVAIHDMQGKLMSIKEMPQTDQVVRFGLNDFADGVYFITVRDGEGVYAKKFIVQH